MNCFVLMTQVCRSGYNYFFNFEHQIGCKMVVFKQLSREENFLNIKKRDPFF